MNHLDAGNLSFFEWAPRMLVAAVAAALVGFERGRRGSDVGIRTNVLVALGSALFTLIGSEILVNQFGDGGRVAAQIVSGIGFLGVGVIVRDRGRVRGITTAATLWGVAGVGMAAGAGFYAGAILFVVIAVLVLELSVLARRLNRASAQITLTLDRHTREVRVAIAAALEQLGIGVAASDRVEDQLVLRRLTLPRGITGARVFHVLSQLEGVAAVTVDGVRSGRRKRRPEPREQVDRD